MDRKAAEWKQERFSSRENFEQWLFCWVILSYIVNWNLNILYSYSIFTQQANQLWINVETTLIVNVRQRCFNVDIWLKMKVEPTHIYRRCFNVDKTTLKQRQQNYVDSISMNQCCFNVETWLKLRVELTYVYRRCFSVDKTLLKQHWKNYDNSMSMTQCCFSVDIWLKMKVESTYVHRCCFDVEKTAFEQLCQLLHWSVLMFTRKTKTKQN